MSERRVEYTRLSEVKPASTNPKEHDIGAIVTSISKRGFVELPALDERTGRLVAGHGRIEALAAMKRDSVEVPNGLKKDADGEWLVPILHGWASKSDADAKAYLVASNRLVELGGWDTDALDALLVEIAKSDADALSGTGYDGDDVDDILKKLGESDEAPEVPVIDDSDVWVKSGDMYRLGEHVILCGDSTKPEDVDRVMGDCKADMVWTDPPYGVDYGNQAGEVLNDDKAGLPKLLEGAFASCFRVMKPGAFIYVAFADKTTMIFLGEFLKAGFTFRQILAWVKDAMVLSWMDYHSRYEPIIYGLRPAESGKYGRTGNGLGWFGGDDQTTVLEFPKPQTSDEHPTMKPVELVEAMVKNSSAPGHVLFEPFSGSGTTLLACERLGRRCRAIELSPRYVQVAVERWKAMTGGDAVKL